uniref:Matrix metallopeptidase 17b n=1 Tax=Cyprinus carpio TaxID=7962 RepID=A0A8C1J624_CYPCA
MERLIKMHCQPFWRARLRLLLYPLSYPQKMRDWLTKYGYLPPADPSTGQLQAWTAVTQAVKKMQRFAGLDDTGMLDEETVQLMQTPRCSLPDDDDQIIQTSALHSDMQNQRMKRAASTWTRRNINWRLRSYPASSKLSREMIRSLVYYALRVWADPTLLEFHEVRGPEGADLQIDFLRGPHGDGYPFDGAGGSVGHAFFPSDPDRAGGVHLDAEEEWAFREPATEGTDLFTVLVHELGHALGLTHSSARQSVMRPYYQGPLGDPLHFSLGHHDLQHITALYGKRGNHVPTDRPHLVTEGQLRHRHGGAHRLTHIFDAVAKIRGEIFFFKGENMWRVSRGGLVSVRAAPVQRLWSALPSSLPPLQAVLERHTDHAIIFISGQFPSTITSQTIVHHTFESSTYLFKGNFYWKFTHPGSAPEEGYPHPGDISLISHYGQQELREQKGQRIIDQIIHKEKNERDKPLRWDCPCLNSAVTQSGPILLLPILFLITGTCYASL